MSVDFENDDPDDAREAIPDPQVIEVTEEIAIVDKVDRVRGRVQVSTKTEAYEELVRETVDGAEVEVTHVRIDRPLSPGEPLPTIRQEDNITIVPVFEEVVIVEKRLVLREEIHIRRRATREEVEVPVTLRRQHAIIEREEGNVARDVKPDEDQ